MEELIHDLLEFAQLEAGALAIEPHAIEVRTLLAAAAESLAPLADRKSLSLDVLSDPDHGGVAVRCDPRRAAQILSNLVGNAIKFTPEGGSVVLQTEVIDREVQFTVSDSGPGIPADEVAHVFDRHWQSRTGDRSGFGLGLSIAKQLVEGHGGHISVASRLHQGTAFSFTLPRAA
jgi:signal transduction histidine kinase